MFCPECKAEYRDGFTRCSDCDVALVDRLPVPEATSLQGSTGIEIVKPDDLQQSLNPIACARCQQELDYVGTKRFHEGTNWGVLGELGELFVKREHFDVYLCPKCGRVEFFVDGIGEKFRPH